MYRLTVRLTIAWAAPVAVALSILAVPVAPAGSATAAVGATPCDVNCQAIDSVGQEPVTRDGGPPGLVVLVDRGGSVNIYSFATSEVVSQTPITATDHLRLASVSKAYSGAVALALVAKGTLHLSDRVGSRVHGLAKDWRDVTLAELLHHTSGIPDFIRAKEFATELTASPYDPPSRYGLVRLAFPLKMAITPPGSAYRYSNTDNELVALMIQAVADRSDEHELATLVTGPLGLADTSLPQTEDLPAPFAHGYAVKVADPPVDVTNAFSAGWSWASGGLSPRRPTSTGSSVPTPAGRSRLRRSTPSSSRSGPAPRSPSAPGPTRRGSPSSGTPPAAAPSTATRATPSATRSSRRPQPTAHARWPSRSTVRSPRPAPPRPSPSSSRSRPRRSVPPCRPDAPGTGRTPPSTGSVVGLLGRAEGEGEVADAHEQRGHVPTDRGQGGVQGCRFVEDGLVDGTRPLVGDLDGALGVVVGLEEHLLDGGRAAGQGLAQDVEVGREDGQQRAGVGHADQSLDTEGDLDQDLRRLVEVVADGPAPVGGLAPRGPVEAGVDPDPGRPLLTREAVGRLEADVAQEDVDLEALLDRLALQERGFEGVPVGGDELGEDVVQHGGAEATVPPSPHRQ